jgi:sodium/bile acid cotransporter 7
LPLMLFHQIQLMVCAWLARRYAARPAVFQPVEGLLAGFGTDVGRGAGPAAQDIGV